MQAEIVAYMIYLEGLEYPEYVMHTFYRNMLGNSLPVCPAQQATEIDETFGLSTIKHNFLA